MPGEVMIIKGQLRSGFMYPMIKFVAISDTDILAKEERKRRKHGYSGTNISSFTDLNIGDYVGPRKPRTWCLSWNRKK
mgnify:CR=1 FL=1